MKNHNLALPISIALLIVAGVLRVEPHLANATPFFAVTIVVGFLLGRERAWLAGVLSAVAMFVGDLVIGLHWTMVFVYAGVALAALIGAYSRSLIMTSRLASVLTAGLASTTFFIVSNVGVWLVGELYPRTLAGLGTCFAMAIPFFARSLTTDLIFGSAFLMVAAWYVQSSTAVSVEAKVSHGR